MNKRFLFEIDGPEYAGKTTTVTELVKQLNNFEFFRTPGSAPIAEKLRPIVKECDMSSEVAVGIMLASMGDFYQYVVKHSKNNVITDRGLVSSIIYQGFLNKCFDNCLELYNTAFDTLKNMIESNFEYYRIILSINADTVMKRKAIRDAVESNAKDKYDNMDYTGHETLCEYYRIIGIGESLYNNHYKFLYDRYFDRSRTIIIDCNNLTQEEVIDKVKQTIKTILLEEKVIDKVKQAIKTIIF